MTEASGESAGPGATVDLAALVTATDIRGDADSRLTPVVARAFGAAFADHLTDRGEAQRIIVGRDMRRSSSALAESFIDGARRRGAEVFDTGLASTDQLSCGSGLHRMAGAMITASHNPAADNGIKLCLAGARSLSRDAGLADMRRIAEGYLEDVPVRGEGSVRELDTLEDYIATLLDLVPLAASRPLRVAVDAANAMAGRTVPALVRHLPQLEIIPLYFDLDGSFPHHPADPLVPDNLRDLQQAVRREGADVGLAFDGDADRCVVLDETGAIIPPSAIGVLIAEREIARARSAGEREPAVVGNVVTSRHLREVVERAGGRYVRSRTGHALIKALMAESDAVFGAEHSAHYYFRDFFHADSGLLAALHVLAALTEDTRPASALVEACSPYAASGEINLHVADVGAAIRMVRGRLEQARADAAAGLTFDELDGLTAHHWDQVTDPDRRWWFSLRGSNTQALLRLNVEAAEVGTMERVRDEVLGTIRSIGAGT